MELFSRIFLPTQKKHSRTWPIELSALIFQLLFVCFFCVAHHIISPWKSTWQEVERNERNNNNNKITVIKNKNANSSNIPLLFPLAWALACCKICICYTLSAGISMNECYDNNMLLSSVYAVANMHGQHRWCIHT